MQNVLGRTLRGTYGEYRLHELVASGGFGAVFFGRDLRTNTPVAVKLLHPHHTRDARVVRQFEREAELFRGVRHPNVVQVLDQGRDEDGAPFIVQEWVTGWTIAALLQRNGAFPPGEAAADICQVLDGLEVARQRGVIHRDIKPLNLMVTADGVVKVMDFGIAKDEALAAAGGSTVLTGTPAYMAPEQFRGEPLDGRVDLYALGITLYEMLAGKTPFEAPSWSGYMFQHLHSPPPPLATVRPELSPQLVAIVERAMAKAPADRFQSPGEMRAALIPFAGRTTQPSGPLPPPPRTEPSSVPVVTEPSPRRTPPPEPEPQPEGRTPPPVRRTVPPPWQPAQLAALGVAVLILLAGGVWAVMRLPDLEVLLDGGPPPAIPTSRAIATPGGAIGAVTSVVGSTPTPVVATRAPSPATTRQLVTTIGAVTRVPTPLRRGTLTLGQPVSGELRARGERHAYTFAGQADQDITIDLVAPLSRIDPYLTLLDPDGRTLAEDDDSGDGLDARLHWRLPRTGIYTIVASHFGDDETGTYGLTVGPGRFIRAGEWTFTISVTANTCGPQPPIGQTTTYRLRLVGGGSTPNIGDGASFDLFIEDGASSGSYTMTWPRLSLTVGDERLNHLHLDLTFANSQRASLSVVDHRISLLVDCYIEWS